MKPRIHDADAYITLMLDACVGKRISVANLAKSEQEPLYLLTPEKLTRRKPHILFAGSFHGNEPAGSWSILDFIRGHYDAERCKADISFLPLVNYTGFKNNTRTDGERKNPNRKYDRLVDEASIVNKVLMGNMDMISRLASDCVVSLHEDTGMREAYIYACGDKPSKLAVELREVLHSHFKLASKAQLDREELYSTGDYVNDIIINEHDWSFEDGLCRSYGIPECITTETPGKQDIRKRIDCGVDIIQKTIEVLSAK